MSECLLQSQQPLQTLWISQHAPGTLQAKVKKPRVVTGDIWKSPSHTRGGESAEFDISHQSPNSEITFRFLSRLWAPEIAEAINHKCLQKSGTLGRILGDRRAWLRRRVQTGDFSSSLNVYIGKMTVQSRVPGRPHEVMHRICSTVSSSLFSLGRLCGQRSSTGKHQQAVYSPVPPLLQSEAGSPDPLTPS